MAHPTPLISKRGWPPPWWPSEWGPEDQRGAANRLTPDKVLEANKLIKQGKVFSLGRVYEHGMPLPGKRHFSLTIPGSPTYGPSGKNQTVAFDEIFSGEIGQIGTLISQPCDRNVYTF